MCCFIIVCVFIVLCVVCGMCYLADVDVCGCYCWIVRFLQCVLMFICVCVVCVLCSSSSDVWIGNGLMCVIGYCFLLHCVCVVCDGCVLLITHC
jgi:hypothetical protein